jgi:hypothetical protein
VEVRYREGLAIHPDPESCAAVRKDIGEALTGADASRVLSREVTLRLQGASAVKISEGQHRVYRQIARYIRTLRGLRLRARIEAHLAEDGRSRGWPPQRRPAP